jgi:hypothetical protein
MTDERLDEIKTRWNISITLPMSVPWGKDDVVWLVGEVTRLRAEAKRADEEATKLANSDLATTEQVVRALRVENDALRAKVRTITEHYKPGWVDGLKAVARNAGFDPDDAPHDGVDPPTFIAGPSPEGLVSYTLGGDPPQHVIESRTRLALRDHDSDWWRLKRKGPKARSQPLSDWDYEDLRPTGISATSEARAVLWVMGVKGWRDV